MTTPAGATTPWPLTPGAPAQRISDGANNSPAGLLLVNPGTNGQTIYIAAGPGVQTGAVPLGPGAQLSWTDTAAMPYAYLPATATAGETLIVTSQADSYANPAATAAATATQLLTSGVPLVFRDVALLPANGGIMASVASGQLVQLDVSSYASVQVTVRWEPVNNPGPAAFPLTFYNPTTNQTVETVYVSGDSAVNAGFGTWRMPVLAGGLQIQNDPTTAAPGTLRLVVTGSSRPEPVLRQLNSGIGALSLWAANGIPTAGTRYVLTPENNNTATPTGAQRTAPGLDQATRCNGPVVLQVFAGSFPGSLLFYYVDETGSYVLNRLRITAADTTIQFAHPSVPVYWSYTPDAASTGQNVRLTVIQA